MATYNYLDDVLAELRKDKDAVFDQTMLTNIINSIEEWLKLINQLDKQKWQHYHALLKEHDLTRINSKGQTLDVASGWAKTILAKRSRAGLRTLDEIVEHYKKGYELIHRIRELVTQQDIVYSILYSTRRRKNGFKPLLEAHLTLDQVLEHMRPAYSDIKKVKNFKTEFSNVISLSFANADARRAVNEAEREGLSVSNAIEKRELWDTLEEYAEIYYPKVNRGRLYEVYSILVKTPDYEGIEHVGHYEGQANTETLAGDLIERSLKDTDYGWQKGDIALEQLKAAYNANVSFMEASTVKRVLKEILAALKSQSQEAMIEELKKVFTVAKTEFNLEVDKLVKEEAEVAIAEKIKEGNLFDIK